MNRRPVLLKRAGFRIGTIEFQKVVPGKMFSIRVSKSAVIGMGLAVALGVLAYALAPFFDAVGVYAAPGIIFLPLMPSQVGYWLDRDGGPSVGVFLLLLCATFFWTILFGAVHYAWVSS